MQHFNTLALRSFREFILVFYGKKYINTHTYTLLLMIGIPTTIGNLFKHII